MENSSQIRCYDDRKTLSAADLATTGSASLEIKCTALILQLQLIYVMFYQWKLILQDLDYGTSVQKVLLFILGRGHQTGTLFWFIKADGYYYNRLK